MCKLSIIIPIYKVEDYLRKCVDSVLNQDLDNYEIILVDDGSLDGCPQICDEYAAAHTNIRVIHRENGGLSAARNSGIEVAQGEYIMFIDSDDYIEPNVLRGLLAQMERDNLDVLRYNYQNVRLKNEGVRELESEGNYDVFSPNKDPKRDVDYGATVTDGETFLNERLGPACYAWQFILRRELIMSVQKSEISSQNYNDGMSREKSLNEPLSLNDTFLFKEGIYFEDTEWTPRMLVRAKRVASTPMVVYNYLWREGSITLPTDPKKRDKVIRDKIKLLYGFKEQQKLVDDPQWFVWQTSDVTMSILGILASLPMAERQSYLSELKELDLFPLSAEKEKMLSHRLKIRMANLSPSLYCYLMSIVKCVMCKV